MKVMCHFSLAVFKTFLCFGTLIMMYLGMEIIDLKAFFGTRGITLCIVITS